MAKLDRCVCGVRAVKSHRQNCRRFQDHIIAHATDIASDGMELGPAGAARKWHISSHTSWGILFYLGLVKGEELAPSTIRALRKSPFLDRIKEAVGEKQALPPAPRPQSKEVETQEISLTPEQAMGALRAFFKEYERMAERYGPLEVELHNLREENFNLKKANERILAQYQEPIRLKIQQGIKDQAREGGTH